ncbi:MAG: hypothetical protein DCF15_07150 [Phormidesmis priestleyi]|uniref:Uncharacterized protein n=1 Tax=Phormidesmis priestleyi TaxID=268141 RepID=A0A2W4ZFU5_9CYAN|nr:MAG: hypothetical protein DCF15_07150 [Phormidesmis priestleyi]
MKLRAFTAGLGIIGVIASFSAIKMADAQTTSTEQETEPAVYIQTERELACDRVWNELAEFSADGSSSGFDDFEGITFSAEQQAAYDEFVAQKDAKYEEMDKRVERVENLDGYLGFMSPNGEMPPEVRAFVQNAMDSSTSGQWREWNQKLAELGYEQYGEFTGETTLLYTPELDRESDQISQEFYDQVLSIMTPEQFPQARDNFAKRLRINEVCDRRGPIDVSGVAPGTPRP